MKRFLDSPHNLIRDWVLELAKRGNITLEELDQPLNSYEREYLLEHLTDDALVKLTTRYLHNVTRPPGTYPTTYEEVIVTKLAPELAVRLSNMINARYEPVPQEELTAKIAEAFPSVVVVHDSIGARHAIYKAGVKVLERGMLDTRALIHMCDDDYVQLTYADVFLSEGTAFPEKLSELNIPGFDKP